MNFHPFEIAFCGHSGVGKTTLLTKLIHSLSPEFKIGYLKRDAHRFEMDKEGKDTYKAWHNGAARVFITDSTHSALLSNSKEFTRSQMLECDFVFVEGWKDSSLPKVIFIDDHILEEIKDHNSIIAFIGKQSAMSGLPARIPYFQRDEIDKILFFLRDILLAWSERIPLYGLVLAGGYSQRMQRDKALIDYWGKSQGEHCFDLLSSVTERIYLSVRNEQSILDNLPKITDRFLGFGPLGGILSAMLAHPNAAWMVIACDLPNLDRKTLLELRRQRAPFKFATAYENLTTGHLEPLCAIYEPKCYLRFMEFLGNGIVSPIKMLALSSIKRIKLASSALENVNS